MFQKLSLLIKELMMPAAALNMVMLLLKKRFKKKQMEQLKFYRKKDAAEYVSTPTWTNCAPKFSSAPNYFTDMISGKSPWNFSR
ncbi:hypothetical protein AVEN_57510-1 [Araneus ventricosus]|uniref:Uncharacterized protein n=1 Tax=Araneus ventricosus TaxID=182803 RepID=A0A4Y1ZN48_ARAVE|nr:hypothetical protein AVEN_239819-1 [Araneus ventricosus]GBL59842.1 hypothetical protein AVEN_50778-1 [Araneus ventricosus]GBO14537.1 hypothetical protein AVEN_57510-1 [Araneus ventricosus]